MNDWQKIQIFAVECSILPGHTFIFEEQKRINCTFMKVLLELGAVQHIAVEIRLNAEVDHATVHKLRSPLSPLFANVDFRTGIVCIYCPL